MEDELFLRFEEKFRGSRETIKERLQVYLPIIKPLSSIHSSHRVIDLGCGRGEWLELLRDNGWQATGVDANLSMVNYCQQLGLDALHNDAIAYLRSLSSGSVAVVSGFHIAEHLPFELLLELVKESNRVLLPGGFLIIETPNPENLTVGTSSFYLDPTHLNPIPHELMLFLSDQCGFQRAKVLLLQEPPDLKASKTTDLFAVLFGVSPDYAIIAQKEASSEILEAFDTVYAKEYGLSLQTLTNRYDSQIVAKDQKHTLDLSGIRAEMQELRTDLETILKDQKVLQNEMQEVSTDLESTRNEQDVLQNEMQEVKTDLESTRNEQDVLQNEMQEVRTDLESTRNEQDVLQKNLDTARAELEHVYHSRSYRITAPLRAVMGFIRVLREWMKTRVNKVIVRLANEIVKHPKLRTKAFLLLKHFPRLQTRIKGLTSSVKYESSAHTTEDLSGSELTEDAEYFYSVLKNLMGKNK